jgi:hypothetical protein
MQSHAEDKLRGAPKRKIEKSFIRALKQLTTTFCLESTDILSKRD